MRHKGRTMLAALVAVLALGVVASASASAALPEFAPEGGKFPVALEYSSASQSAYIENKSGTTAGKCQGVYAKGSITGAKTLSLTIELQSCGREQCTTEGSENRGEILSGSASLVYINKSKKEVGVVLTQPRVELTCFGAETFLRGGLVIPFTSINTKTTKLGVAIKRKATKEGHEEKGIQEFQSYENEKSETVKANLEWNVGSGYTTSDLEAGAFSLTASKALTVEG